MIKNEVDEQIKMLLQNSRKFFSTYWHMNYNTVILMASCNI